MSTTHPCQVEFDKFFLSGILDGIQVTEKMGFMSWNDACDWAGTCTMSLKTNFVILEMREPSTGNKENF